MLFNHSVQNIWQVQQKVSPQVLKEELVRWLCNLHWLLVSKGERLGATKLDAQRQDGQVIVSWNLAAETKLSSGNDMLMLLALNTTTLECSCNLDAGRRSKGQAFIPEPPALPNEKILLFIAFRKIIGTAKKSLTNISTSQWVDVEWFYMEFLEFSWFSI